MSNTVNGIKYYLSDDCDTLICKLENALDDLYMNSHGEETKIDNLEVDLEKLQRAIQYNNQAIMQEILNKYAHWFKRYRHR